MRVDDANKWDYVVVSDYFILEDIREDIFDMFFCDFIIENKTVSHYLTLFALGSVKLIKPLEI